MSTRQYARIVDEWVEAIGLRPEECGTHSRRRTKASIIYKATGNIRAIQILLGHSKIENTVRYLGVDIEDALTLAEKTENSLELDAGPVWASVRLWEWKLPDRFRVTERHNRR